jgi:hypothetical protein
MIPLSALKLNLKRHQHYSQRGEDGVLAYILSSLPTQDRFLVEFGAWDGKHLSNSFHLIERFGYHGVLIEMEIDRFQLLEANMRKFNCTCINAMVGYEGKNTLDHILSFTNTPKDFDLLSIDIDSNDYQVWEALMNYSPKVVIIEIKSSVLPGVIEIHDQKKSGDHFSSGSSISAITRLAEEKNYRLICNIGCNAIFVRKEYYKLFHKNDLSEFDLFTYETNGVGTLSFQQFFHSIPFRFFQPKLFRRFTNSITRNFSSK